MIDLIRDTADMMFMTTIIICINCLSDIMIIVVVVRLIIIITQVKGAELN